MTFIKSETLSITTTTGGTYSASTDEVNGRLLEIRYASTGIASTGVCTVSCTATGETLLAFSSTGTSRVIRPRFQLHGTTGTTLIDLVYPSTGTVRQIAGPAYFVNEKLKFAVAGGGVSKTGTVKFVIG